MRVVATRAVAGEMLERGQDSGVVHSFDERLRVGGHALGVRGKRPAERDDGGIEGIHGDVHDGRQVPVDPGVAKRRTDAPSLSAGHVDIVGLPELLSGKRRRIAETSRKAHHTTALVVRRDEQRAADALPGQSLKLGSQSTQLLGAYHVARSAGGAITLEQDDATDLDVANEVPDLFVASDLGSGEADQEKLGDRRAWLWLGVERAPAEAEEHVSLSTSRRSRRRPVRP